MRATLLVVALTSGCSGLTATDARTPTPGRLLRPHTRATAPSMALLAPTLRSAAVVLGAANLAQYHIQLMRSEAAGQPTWRAAQSAARSSWARFVRETSGWLYAIQTLRNAITASTFLASTVLTLFTVTMGYLSNSMSKSFEWLVLLRFSATGFLLLCSSYSFLQSARCRRPIVRHDHLHYHHLGCTHPRRYMTHAGFMFPVARDPGDGNEICLSDDPDELCMPTPVSEEAPRPPQRTDARTRTGPRLTADNSSPDLRRSARGSRRRSTCSRPSRSRSSWPRASSANGRGCASCTSPSPASSGSSAVGAASPPDPQPRASTPWLRPTTPRAWTRAPQHPTSANSGELAFLGATLLMRNFLAGVDRPPALAEIQTDKSDGGAGYAI